MESEGGWIRNVAPAFVSLACVLLLLAGDIALGYRKMVGGDGDEQIEGVHEPHPTLGWALRPGSTGRHESPGNFSVSYGIGEDGLRRVANRGEATRRIWVFGDSFTFGHGVPDEDTYTSVLAKELLAPGIHVMNAGVMGYGIAQELQRLMTLADRIQPGDLVVFAPISNDVERNYKHFSYPSKYLFRSSKGSIEHYPDLQHGALGTAALDTPWNRLKALLYHARFTGAGIERLHHALFPPGATNEARVMLELARKTAEARGARFALLFLPHPDECASGEYRVDLSPFEFPDLRSSFPNDEAGVAAIHFPDDRHWNARGHELAARAVVRGLLELGLLSPGDLRAGLADELAPGGAPAEARAGSAR